jgi:hypothetical protein
MRFTGSASVTKAISPKNGTLPFLVLAPAATRYLEPVTVPQAPRKVIFMLEPFINRLPFGLLARVSECKTPAVPHPARR